MPRLKITEIFYSLQGESRSVGWPTVFIRLTGCPLRCVYCDTTYAFKGGEWWSLEDILQEVSKYQVKHITVTGGEPLAQKDCLQLLEQLCEKGYEVSLETSGAMDVSGVDVRVSKVMDLKTPASEEEEKNLYSNVECLNADDQVKFVISDREDYEWSKQKIAEFSLLDRCELLFSPTQGVLEAAELADWMLKDQLLGVRFQLQLHKYLWGNEPGR